MAIKNLISKATGLNWWKWGAVLVLYVASVVGAFYAGVYNERLEQAEDAATAAKETADLIVEEVKARLPIAQKGDNEAAKLRAEIAGLKGQLRNAINQKPSRPECALSDDELRYFREIGRYSE